MLFTVGCLAFRVLFWQRIDSLLLNPKPEDTKNKLNPIKPQPSDVALSTAKRWCEVLSFFHCLAHGCWKPKWYLQKKEGGTQNRPWVLPPLSNSWITVLVELCPALILAPTIDCFWVGAILNIDFNILESFLWRPPNACPSSWETLVESQFPLQFPFDSPLASSNNLSKIQVYSLFITLVMFRGTRVVLVTCFASASKAQSQTPKGCKKRGRPKITYFPQCSNGIISGRVPL